MTMLSIKLDGDACWPDLLGKPIIAGRIVGVARLPMGTSGGRSSVTFRIELEDGRTVLAETTWRLMEGALVAVQTREAMEAEAQGKAPS